MGSRRRPAEEAEQYQDEAEELAAPSPRPRRPPDRNPAWLYFTHRETGTDGGRRQYTPDPALWVRCIKGNNERPGVYDVEVRNKNQSIIDRAEIEVTAEAVTISAQTTQTTPPVQAANDAAQVLGSFAESFVAINKVAKENAPQPVDFEQLITKVAEKLQPPQPPPPPPPPSLAQQLGELAKVKDSLGALFGVQPAQQQPPPQQQGDSIENFLSMYERVQDLNERVTPNPESKGWGAQLGSLVEGVGRGVEKLLPAIPQLLTAARMGAQMLTPPQQQQPQPGVEGQQQAQQQAQQPMLPEPFAGVLRIIVDDCTADATVDRSADAIGSAIKSQPELEATFAQWLSAPASQLVEVIAQYGQAPWLTRMSTSIAWFSTLQEELSERSQAAQGEEDEQSDASPVQPSTNGHKVSGAEVVQ